jgi:uncharacterized protein YndB with AHSA1/START domain
MTDTTTERTTTKLYRVYIRASAQQVWDAITDPEWNSRYGYPGRTEFDLRPGGAVRAILPPGLLGSGEFVGVDGEVVECDPPHRLVQTYRFLFTPDQVEEGFHEVVWDVHEEHGGVTRLTVTHDVTNAPLAASMIDGDPALEEGGGGWPWILSGLKTLLETGGTIAS